MTCVWNIDSPLAKPHSLVQITAVSGSFTDRSSQDGLAVSQMDGKSKHETEGHVSQVLGRLERKKQGRS